jgi:hypothetical protein
MQPRTVTKRLLAVVAFMVVLGLGPARAEMLSPTSQLGPTYRLKSTLRPQNVVGPRPHVSRSAKGVFSAELRPWWRQGGKINPRLTLVGTTAHVTSVHIHLGARGRNGFIVFPTPGLSLPNRILLTASFIWPAGDLMPDLLAGPTYIDVHTKANPRGELRGQITVERIS